MRQPFRFAEVTVEHERRGLRGRDCILISWPVLGLKLRLQFADAETLGEALIKVVRQAEESTLEKP